jgi:hypothetical protein
MSIDQTPSDRSVAAVDLDAKIQAEHSDFAIEKAREPDDHDMTPEEEARMVRKLDLHIFPILICLYILSFLDRVNIGRSQVIITALKLSRTLTVAD